MRTRRPTSDHEQRPSAHAQVAPAFRSPDTAPTFAKLLAAARAAVDHHGREAQARRQDAEEQLRHIKGREQLIAEKVQEIEEFHAEKEREIASLRDEIARMGTAAKNADGQAAQHTQEQENAELHAQDLEGLLGAHAPAALQLAAPAGGTPPTGIPTTDQPGGTGEYAQAAGNGTGPQPAPAPQQGR